MKVTRLNLLRNSNIQYPNNEINFQFQKETGIYLPKGSNNEIIFDNGLC